MKREALTLEEKLNLFLQKISDRVKIENRRISPTEIQLAEILDNDIGTTKELIGILLKDLYVKEIPTWAEKRYELTEQGKQFLKDGGYIRQSIKPEWYNLWWVQQIIFPLIVALTVAIAVLIISQLKTNQ